MRGFLAFAICFFSLVQIWFHHYRFFRRYGLEDIGTIALNTILLFITLFFVYPLKFLFAVVVGDIGGPEASVLGAASAEAPLVRADQGARLLEIYSAGLAAVFLVFAALYLHAWRQRAKLELDPLEVHTTRWSGYAHLMVALLACCSIVAAATLPPQRVGWAGWMYFLLPVLFTAHGFLRRFTRRKLASGGRRIER